MRCGPLALGLALALSLPASGADPEAGGLAALDLSGEWYVLVHYKDERSEDESLTKFRDFSWAIRQEDGRIAIGQFPYVMFGEELEGVRRRAMREHEAWEPDAELWKRIRSSFDVSARAASSHSLQGSRAEGFASPPPIGGGGIHSLSFARSWRVEFAPQRIRIAITDSLSGSGSLAAMEGSTLYDIVERVADDELRGTYEESTKRGTFRMVRSRKRNVVR